MIALIPVQLILFIRLFFRLNRLSSAPRIPSSLFRGNRFRSHTGLRKIFRIDGDQERIGIFQETTHALTDGRAFQRPGDRDPPL